MESENSSSGSNEKVYALVGVPLWYGAGKPGTEDGPPYLLNTGLEEKLRVRGIRNVGWYMVVPETLKGEVSKQKAKYETEISYTQRKVFRMVTGFLVQGYIPIVIGGDHSVSIGSIAAQSIDAGAARKIGVIWIDAHGDVHTPKTSPSGNIHGMPLAVSLGYGLESLVEIGGLFGKKVCPHNVIHAGGNSLENVEQQFVDTQSILFFSKKDIDTCQGFNNMLRAVEELGKRVERVIVSIDLDVFDKNDAPGVHFQNENGVLKGKIFALLEHIKKHCPISGVDIAEFVPSRDIEDKTANLLYEVLVCLLSP